MPFSRRKLLKYAGLLSSAGASSWLLHRHMNAMPTVSVNRVGMAFGHALRDGLLSQDIAHEHSCHILILGSGAAGLAAAWQFHRQGIGNVLLAEGIERNGNNAAFRHGGLSAPSGAHYLALPSLESRYVREMLSDLSILEKHPDSAQPQYRESDLVHAPSERLWHRGKWQDALLPETDHDSQRFFSWIEPLKSAYGSDGRKIFAIPVALSSQDAEWRALDHMTFVAWLNQEGYQSPSLRWYLDYCCRDDYGQGIAQVSAFAGLHYFAARGVHDDAVLTWPQGLAHLSDALRAHINIRPLEDWPARQVSNDGQISCVHASAIDIREESDQVEVILFDHQHQRAIRVKAQYVISAMPLAVAARVCRYPERYGLQQQHLPSAPWLVSNFVLQRFPPEKDHAELAWDNVVHDSAGLGYVVATHQLIRVAKPEKTVFTAYTALNHASPSETRHWLMHAADETLLQHAAQDIVEVYGKSVWRHIEHVDITVRAHGMSVPLPGYLDHPLLHAVRDHDSRLVFAHSDMSGYSVFEEAVYWGAEAANKIIARISS